MKFKKEFALYLALLAYAKTGGAFDWYLDPGFIFSERYTNNLLLAPPQSATPRISTFISTFSPNLRLGYLTNNSEGNVAFQYNQYIYHNDESFDFGEKVLNANHIFKGGERWKTNITGKYAIESSVTTQLDVNSGGYVAAQLPRTTRSINPEFSYTLTDKDTLALGVSYLDVNFDRHPNGAFINYISKQAYTTVNHSYTQNLSFNLNTSYSWYDAGGGPSGTYPISSIVDIISAQNSKTFSFQLGTQYTPIENIVLKASAGIRQTDSKSSVQRCYYETICLDPQRYSNNAAGNIYSASLQKTFERGNVLLSANQQLNPASTGSQQQSTSFNANGLYELTERWSLGISGIYQITNTVAASQIFNNYNRTYYNISPNIQWKWTPDVNLQLTYTYLNQHFSSQQTTASSDSLMLQLNYQPPINRQVK